MSVRTAIIALGLVASPASLATTPVLHPGDDPGGAVARASAASKIPAEEFNPLTIRQLVEGQPARLEGAGTLAPCSGAPTDLQALRDVITRAQKAIGYVDNVQASTGLRAGEAMVACLREPLDATVAGRLYFLLGLSLFNQGQLTDAKEAFKRANVYQPGLPWDDYYAPKGKPLFDTAASDVAALKPVSVELVPTPAPEAVWVDGYPVTFTGALFSLSPGSHVLQVATPTVVTLTLTVEPLDGTRVIIPAAIPADAILWASDPAKQATLSSVLGTVLPAGSTVFVSSGSSIWQGTIGTSTWTELEVPTGFFAGVGVPRSKFYAGQTLFWTGGAAAVGGGSLTVVSLLQLKSAARDGTRAESYETYTNAESDYQSAQDRVKVGGLILGGGAVVAGVGGVITLSGGGVVVPQLLHDGAGVSVGWGW